MKTIKQHCKDKGLKLGWLSDQLDVTGVTLSKWNKQEIRPHRLFIERICEILDIPQDSLLLKSE